MSEKINHSRDAQIAYRLGEALALLQGWLWLNEGGEGVGAERLERLTRDLIEKEKEAATDA